MATSWGLGAWNTEGEEWSRDCDSGFGSITAICTGDDAGSSLPRDPAGVVLTAGHDVRATAMALGWSALAVEAEARVPVPDRGLRTPAPGEELRGSVSQVSVGGGAVSEAAFRALICAPVWAWDCEEAIDVFRCESDDFRPDVVYGPTEGAAGERGIAQLAPVHAQRFYRRGYTWADAFDPVRNLEVAHELYTDYGSWWHWRFSRGCHGY